MALGLGPRIISVQIRVRRQHLELKLIKSESERLKPVRVRSVTGEFHIGGDSSIADAL
jgi:hypothetical protein